MAETTRAKLTNNELSGDSKAEEEEEEASEEGDLHDEMLHSLTREKGCSKQYLYCFQQFWCLPPIVNHIISFRKNFQEKHNDIVISSLPKSGTTWMKALAFAIVKRNCFIPSQNNHPLLHSNPHILVPFFEFDLYRDDPNNVIPDLSTFFEPRMIGTHIPIPYLSNSIHNSNCKIIYICCNPFDAFISLWHFSNNILSSQSLPTLTLEEPFEKYCKGINEFGPFWSQMLGYWKASKDTSNKVMFLKYDVLKAKTKFELKRIAQFLDYPFTPEEESGGIIDSIIELCSFGKMKEFEINKSGKTSGKNMSFVNRFLFRKGEIEDWVNYFSPWMIEILSKVIEKKLGESGLFF